MYLRVGTFLYGFYLCFLVTLPLDKLSVVGIQYIRSTDSYNDNGMSKTERLKQAETPDSIRPLTSNLTLEERLKVITNLIVDRILEDQVNGKLQFKNRAVLKP